MRKYSEGEIRVRCALKRKAQVKLEGFKKKTEEIKRRRVLMVGSVEKIGDAVVRRTKRKGVER